ncbi:NUDIX hydrolase [Pirellula staleyi DSM 6068]|uniref:8-oxo-dGTP diphosphatase n=1 Tax=Pirellula staleyi (strain ATCC 27377 / DSM 6068 / ICPB 4128) TaxID=530564 RepID=D2QWH3_PIRSD|nr:NUDIX domain-containing protein [Pirellula staleyi]ADB17776.1 NUDIX hydrolase [Pirellula staleyi DSM 6068]
MPLGQSHNSHADSSRPPRRGVVGVIMEQGKLLVIRRSRLVRAPLKYCFPGGSIEPGETEQQAVLRELDEELALDVTVGKKLWHCTTSWGVDLAWWQVFRDPSQEPQIAPSEVDSYYWMTAAEMQVLRDLLPSNYEFLKLLAQQAITIDEAP